MTNEVCLPDYDPSERQKLLHSVDAFEIFYGGAAGGGKTLALCAEAINACLDYPGQRVYFFRKTLKNLAQGTYPVMMQQLSPYMNLPTKDKRVLKDGSVLEIKYNTQKSIFNFTNGSFIQFAYLNYTSDIYNYSSIEMNHLIFDEVTQFTGEEYEFLKTRVRSGEDRPLHVISASNPGDIGHNYFRDRFIKHPDPLVKYVPGKVFYEKFIDEETGEEYEISRVFIPAKVSDNPNGHIRQDYRRNLNSIADPQLRKALLLGDWESFLGRIFTEWNEELHVITGKLPVDIRDCERYIGFDWGYNDPGVATWIAVTPPDEDDIRHMFVYREIHEKGWHPKKWAQMISSIVADEPVEAMILPHDCFSHLGGQRTIASYFEEYEIPFLRADSQNHAAKMHRIALLHDLLALGPDGEPAIKFHTNAMNCISTIPTLPYSKTRPEEIDDKADDHDFDSVTYALMVIDDPTMILDNDGSSIIQHHEEEIQEFNRNNIGKAVRDSEIKWLR
jgi:hypothetical protein